MKIDNNINQQLNITLNQTLNRDIDKAKSFANVLEDAAKDDKKLYQTCQELESVFISRVLDSMRATISRSNLLSRGFADDVYESMLYDEYAKNISQSGSTGLADILYQQLKTK